MCRASPLSCQSCLPGSFSGTRLRIATPWCMRWPLSCRVAVAMAVEQLGREDAVEHLGFLQAQDVGLLFGDQPLDQRRCARAPS